MMNISLTHFPAFLEIFNFFSRLSLYRYNFKNQDNVICKFLSTMSTKFLWTIRELKKGKNYRSTWKSCTFSIINLKAGQNPCRKRHVSRFYSSSFVCNHVSYPFCGSGVRSSWRGTMDV